MAVAGRVSVLIPARNERADFVQNTVFDVLRKAAGDVEVIVHLDGYWPTPPLQDEPKLVIIHRGRAHGMRPGINAAAAASRGEFLMKLDAHCAIGEGWDEVLKRDCESNWVVIPRRKSLDVENWAPARKRPNIDYHYLSWPYVHEESPGLHGRWWKDRQEARADVLLDDEMSSQGSCWFMTRTHWERLGGLQESGYGTFFQEFQEVGCKTWLGGGEVKVNKRTWYAHLHKGKTHGRGYSLGRNEERIGRIHSADYWLNNRWPERVRDFEWLIEHFWPVPTWPEDWRSHDFSDIRDRASA